MDYFEKGNALYNIKNYSKAIEMYTKCIEVRENEPSAFYNSAVCFIKLREYKKAIDLLKSALYIREESIYYFNLAYCHAMLNNSKKALIYFNKAWCLNNSDSDCEKAINLIMSRYKKDV